MSRKILRGRRPGSLAVSMDIGSNGPDQPSARTGGFPGRLTGRVPQLRCGEGVPRVADADFNAVWVGLIRGVAVTAPGQRPRAECTRPEATVTPTTIS